MNPSRAIRPLLNLLISWRLWQTLIDFPLQDPFAKRAAMFYHRMPIRYSLFANEKGRKGGAGLVQRLINLFAPLLLLMIIFAVMLIVITLIVSGAWLLPVIVNTGFGVTLCIRVTSCISRDYERRVIEHFGVTPGGMWRLHLACCAVWLNIYRDYFPILLLISVTGFCAAPIFGLGVSTLFTPAMNNVEIISQYAALMAIFLIDLLHSPTLASTIVITFTANSDSGTSQAQARLIAPALYAAVQILTYLIIPIFGLSVLRWVSVGEVAYVLIMLLTVGAFFLARELTITLLWTTFTQRVNASPEETRLEQVT